MNNNVKPNILILGGVGFIGRNLVQYLVAENVAQKIRVVDRTLPQLAWLNAKQKAAFAQVEFKQANLINPKSAANAFQLPDGSHFDFVINCAAETRSDQSEEVYRDGIHKLSSNCMREAVNCHARYVELSTAAVLPSSKKPQSEDAVLSPLTAMARYKTQVEKDLATVIDLNYVVLRPAIVYGVGDKSGLLPRILIAAIYRYLQEKMQLLWTKDLRMNTVHVKDVCRAIWHVCQHGRCGEIFNLADKSDTSQGHIVDILSSLFGIEYEYVGAATSFLAKSNLDIVVQDINEKHVSVWGIMCQRDGIATTPLSPILSEENVLDKDLCVNGSKIEDTGFTYTVPHLLREHIQEILDDHVQTGILPKSLIVSLDQ